MQIQALVEAPPLHGGGLPAELLAHAHVDEREQLVHVRVVHALREHLAQHLDVPRAAAAVAVRHLAWTRQITIIVSFRL